MHGKYYTTTIEPNFDVANGTAYTSKDLVFDWTPFEIPNGAGALVNTTIIYFGKDGVAAQANDDLVLYFAKSNGATAPTSLGTVHAALTATSVAPSRRNVIGMTFIDQNQMVNNGSSLIGYDVLSNTGTGTNIIEGPMGVLLQGDPAYPSTAGYQTIWVAGVGGSTSQFDFDSSIALNMAAGANVDADTTGASVTLTTSGTDPRKVFAPGDIITGSTNTVTMEVVSVDGATQMKVKNISAQIDHTEILNPRNPIKMIFGFEF